MAQALDAWAIVSKQVRYRPMGMYGGIPSGFDFTAVKAILSKLGLWHEEVIDALLIIEDEMVRFYMKEFEDSLEKHK